MQLNAIRASHGLVRLKLNATLSAAAEGHSAEMLADGYFAHNSHNGSPFWKRLQMWMQSPEHRANILNPNWREIGISAVHSDGAPGAFGGQPVTIITTDFGVRH